MGRLDSMGGQGGCCAPEIGIWRVCRAAKAPRYVHDALGCGLLVTWVLPAVDCALKGINGDGAMI